VDTLRCVSTRPSASEPTCTNPLFESYTMMIIIMMMMMIKGKLMMMARVRVARCHARHAPWLGFALRALIVCSTKSFMALTPRRDATWARKTRSPTR
jgi:hypothetical protein